MSSRSVLRGGGLALAGIGLVTALAAQTPAPAAAPEARFDVLEFAVQGNTVLPPRAVEAAVLPHMGEGRTLRDVEAARAALEKAYQDGGWLTVFVDLPEQKVEDGVVWLQVTEGVVDRLRVTGSRYYSQGHIRATAAELAEGRVPNFNTVQSQLALLNRTEDRQVQPVLRPGALPGTVEIELKVDDRLPVSGGVELTNRHSADTEPLRLSASVRHDNFLQRDHSLALTAIVAPQQPEQSRVLVASWNAPLDPSSSLTASFIASDSKLEPLAATTVIGQGITLGLRWSHAFYGRDSSHSLSLGGDYKDLKEDIDAEQGLSTPLRYLPLQAAYNAVWLGPKRSTTLGTSLTVGLRQLMQRDIDCPGNVGPVDQFACKRFGADGGFAAWRGDLRHEQAAWGGIGDDNASLTLRLGWQLATQPLVPSEQINLGGGDTVRGYLESEAVGDHGLFGTIEWRSADLMPLLRSAGDRTPTNAPEVTVSGFIDAGRVQTIDPLPEQRARTPLVGTGVGLRVRAGRSWTADVDLAWPRKTDHQPAPDGDPRLHARVGVQF